MRHFFTRNTVEASIWCVKCHKDTLHAIADGRPLHCKICQEKPLPVAPDSPLHMDEPWLFDEGEQ
jgi:hypothetical protein